VKTRDDEVGVTLVVNQPTSDVAGGGQAEGQLWPMGAVTRRTGIGEHTLRAWERRFGFPAPIRLESGHRRYTAEQVQQLILINTALSCGYRAGEVVPLPRTELEDLLRSCGAYEPDVESGMPQTMVDQLFEACRRFDRDAVATALTAEVTTLGVKRFLRERVGPLLESVGRAWEQGHIEIRHEHFLSEILEDVLRTARTNLERAGSGRPVALATLPDEFHGLGLHIVALAVVAAGRRVSVLGPHMPVDEIAKAAESLDAAAVGLSISIFGVDDATAEAVAELRHLLPATTELWIGGAGAAHLKSIPDGVRVLVSFEDLEAALAHL
jgi:DNA-binding transcriptional MerR regulator